MVAHVLFLKCSLEKDSLMVFDDALSDLGSESACFACTLLGVNT